MQSTIAFSGGFRYSPRLATLPPFGRASIGREGELQDRALVAARHTPHDARDEVDEVDPAIRAPEQQGPVVGAEGDAGGPGVAERVQRGQRTGVADRDFAGDERHDAAPIAAREHRRWLLIALDHGSLGTVRPVPTLAPLCASKRLTSVPSVGVSWSVTSSR